MLVAAALAVTLGCVSSPERVRVGEPWGVPEPEPGGVRFDSDIALSVRGVRNLPGTSRWNEVPGVEEMAGSFVRAQSYEFPVAVALERATRDALVGPFRSVVAEGYAPLRVEARIGTFRLRHSGEDSEAECHLSVRYRIFDENGREIEAFRYEASGRSHFDGEKIPRALWAALYSTALELRRDVAASRAIAREVQRTAPPAPPSPEIFYADRPPLRPPPSVPTPAYRPGYRRKLAAVIGIDAYEHWPRLEGAASDARRVATQLRGQGFRVIEIYDREATRERILRLLGDELQRLTGPESLAVVFFAGHGQTETLPNGEKRGYIVPVDGNRRRVFSTAVSMQTLRDLSNRLSAKHVYYAMDSCYSGLGLSRGISIPPMATRYFDKVTSRPVVQMITAGQEGEQAMERGGRGVFTSYFLRALQGEADLNHDGYVTASEIGAFVPQHVSNATAARQTPRFGTLEGTGEVVFEIRH